MSASMTARTLFHMTCCPWLSSSTDMLGRRNGAFAAIVDAIKGIASTLAHPWAVPCLVCVSSLSYRAIRSLVTRTAPPGHLGARACI
jgi:hypothetical protein